MDSMRQEFSFHIFFFSFFVYKHLWRDCLSENEVKSILNSSSAVKRFWILAVAASRKNNSSPQQEKKTVEIADDRQISSHPKPHQMHSRQNVFFFGLRLYDWYFFISLLSWLLLIRYFSWNHTRNECNENSTFFLLFFRLSTNIISIFSSFSHIFSVVCFCFPIPHVNELYIFND